jgi:hypothetical protein
MHYTYLETEKLCNVVITKLTFQYITYVYCILNMQVVSNIINAKLKTAYLKDFMILGLFVYSAAHKDIQSTFRHIMCGI